MLPAAEHPLTDESISQFRSAWREQFSQPAKNCPIYCAISEGQSIAGIEYYIPLFFDSMASIFDYLPENTLCFFQSDLIDQAKHFYTEVQHRHEQLRYDVERPLLDIQQLFLEPDELFAALKAYQQIKIIPSNRPTPTQAYSFDVNLLAELNEEDHKSTPANKLQHWISGNQSKTIVCADSPGRVDILQSLLQEHNHKAQLCNSWQEALASNAKISLLVAPFASGFEILKPSITIITEGDIYNHRITPRSRQSTTQDPSLIIKHLTELQVGSAVVHIDYGVGRYQGLQTITTGVIVAEYLTLEYANQDKIYVPVNALHLINRYSGSDADNAPLHKLGSDQWSKLKKRQKSKFVMWPLNSWTSTVSVQANPDLRLTSAPMNSYNSKVNFLLKRLLIKVRLSTLLAKT